MALGVEIHRLGGPWSKASSPRWPLEQFPKAKVLIVHVTKTPPLWSRCYWCRVLSPDVRKSPPASQRPTFSSLSLPLHSSRFYSSWSRPLQLPQRLRWRGSRSFGCPNFPRVRYSFPCSCFTTVVCTVSRRHLQDSEVQTLLSFLSP